MQSPSAGELVTVTGDGPPLDRIVFDTRTLIERTAETGK